MELKFELLEEDYINFNIDHANKSPSLKRNVSLIRILGPVTFLIAPFIIIRFSEIPLWYWMTLFGITSILWLIFYPKHFDWEMRRRIKKMLEEGNSENLFKERKISLTDEAIIETTSSSQSSTIWSRIDRVEETDRYIYIYNSSISAYIIPKRVFKDDKEKIIFLEEVWKQRRKA